MHTVLINGPSGSGKSTLAFRLESSLQRYSMDGVKVIETSSVLEQAANGTGLWIPPEERIILQEALRAGQFYDEDKVAQLMLHASAHVELLLICGMRGARALTYFHQRRPINLMLALQVKEATAIARLITQGRQESEQVRITRYQESCRKFEAAINDVQQLGIPLAYLDGNQSVETVTRQAYTVVVNGYRRHKNKSA